MSDFFWRKFSGTSPLDGHELYAYVSLCRKGVEGHFGQYIKEYVGGKPIYRVTLDGPPLTEGECRDAVLSKAKADLEAASRTLEVFAANPKTHTAPALTHDENLVATAARNPGLQER